MFTDNRKKYEIGVHIWVNEGEGHLLGAGRVRMLQNISRTGSITKAAEMMKMSYRQAWQMINDMNKAHGDPLVEKILGGKGGGGARLTVAGEKAITVFFELESKMRQYASQLAEEVNL